MPRRREINEPAGRAGGTISTLRPGHAEIIWQSRVIACLAFLTACAACQLAAPFSKVRQNGLGSLLRVVFSGRHAHFRRPRSSAFAPGGIYPVSLLLFRSYFRECWIDEIVQGSDKVSDNRWWNISGSGFTSKRMINTLELVHIQRYLCGFTLVWYQSKEWYTWGGCTCM